MNNGTHCKHGIHYADACVKCMPIYTEEELQEAIAEAKKKLFIVTEKDLKLLDRFILGDDPEYAREEMDTWNRIKANLISLQDPLKNALHHFLSFGRPREGSDRYHKAWDKLKESFEGMK